MAQASADNPQAGAGRLLPKKENDLFKSLVKHYEVKQYKKALKQADAVLKKFPNHGETLAMKGLTLYYMSKKEEAHSLVKMALMNDMRSHVCWHVFGLLHRADTNYNEAIKAYKQALRIDKDNLQILRDLSMLQIQMRDLDGFLQTRNTLLTLKPNGKLNWMAFALARHMVGDLEGAVKVIDIYLGTLSEGHAELSRCYESSELAMYRNSILAEMPSNYEAALDHLKVCENVVMDRGAWLMKKAEYQLRLKRFEDTKQTVLEMFHRGMTETYAIHSIYMCAVLRIDNGSIISDALSLSGTRTLASMIPLETEQLKAIAEAYRSELSPKFGESHAVQRIPTSLLSNSELRNILEQRCRSALNKGVPSLCEELFSYVCVEVNGRYVKPSDPVDIMEHPVYSIIVALVDDLLVCLESKSKFSATDEAEQPPSTLLWTWFLRAGLHELVGECSLGVVLLDKCIEHTPTIVDVYELKARLLRAGGDIIEAVTCLDKGRELDLQDRYINNQTTKYMLQAGKDSEARKLIALFTRGEGHAEHQMYEMQCSWYELEAAACFQAKGDFGRSLKKYDAVVKHFDDFNEDQFDFHGYCLRKVTLRAYMSVLRYEDEIFGEEYYCTAAAGIISIYLGLHDSPLTDDSQEPDYSKMTAAERKKAKAVARKKKKAAEKLEAELLAEAAAEVNNDKGGSNQKKGQKAPKVDPDPLGKEYLNKDPLQEAKKYSAMMARYAPKRLKTWILQYDVAIRRKKPLLALQALHKAIAISPNDHQLFSRLVDFAGKHEDFAGASEVAAKLMSELTPALYNGKSKKGFILAAADSIRKDPISALPYRVAVAEAFSVAEVGSTAEAAALITEGGIQSRGVSIETCQSALALLSSWGEPGSGSRAAWVSAVQNKFPLAKNFS